MKKVVGNKGQKEHAWREKEKEKESEAKGKTKQSEVCLPHITRKKALLIPLKCFVI